MDSILLFIPVRSKYSNVLKPWVMALPAPTGLGKALRTNSGLCNVVLRPFRMLSLGQRVHPATMIGFKQIEFFDHTGKGAAVADAAGTASHCGRIHAEGTPRPY